VNKKEAKKTFVTWVRAGENARASDSKSFLLLFFKKEDSSLFYPILHFNHRRIQPPLVQHWCASPSPDGGADLIGRSSISSLISRHAPALDRAPGLTYRPGCAMRGAGMGL
jgi:hypothetical protein